MRNLGLLAMLGACVLAATGCSSEQTDATPTDSETAAAESKPPATVSTETQQTSPESIETGEAQAGQPVVTDDTSAMGLYRKAQALMRDGRKQEGYETAQAAMQKFVADGDDLAWMMLESVEVGDKRIDVHFNMGPKERDTALDGIVKPLSFRVWSTGDETRLLRTLDYENGRFGGQVITAAIGEQRGTVHGNLGMLEPSASYEEILQKVIEIVQDM